MAAIVFAASSVGFIGAPAQAWSVNGEVAVVTPTVHWCSGTMLMNVGGASCRYVSGRDGGYAGTGPFRVRSVRGNRDGTSTTVFDFTCGAAQQCKSDPAIPVVPGMGYVLVEAWDTGAVVEGN